MTTVEAPERTECGQCYGAGWVLDAKVDKTPTTLELIPCIIPDCPFSGREVAVLCLYGEWENPVLHPATGAVMSLTKTSTSRWQSVDSTNIGAVRYDVDSRELRLVISGTVHVYRDVPSWVHDRLLEAPSKGSYFNREVRGIYAEVGDDHE